MRILARLVLPLLLVGCDDAPDDSADAAPARWYLECGDPVCQGYTGPFEGIAPCEGEVEGAACEPEGARCDPVNDCNAMLVCATEDPTQQPGGCPISLRRHKRGVRYLSRAEVEQVRQQALDLKLATWRYRWEGDATPEHLGFIIDDAPASPAVRADGAHVDLYGYTSLALGAVQAQEAELQAMRAELAALRDEVRALRQACPAPQPAP